MRAFWKAGDDVLTSCASVITHGLGRHAATLEISDLVIVLKVGERHCARVRLSTDLPNNSLTNPLTFAQLLLGLECVYLVCVALLKLSLLALYFRIFPTREFKIATYALSGVIILWCIALNCVAIFQCNPIKKSWLPTTPGTCIDLKAAFIGNAIPNIITDVLILMLPVRQIWKLQMHSAQRLSLIAMFLLGGLCVLRLLP